MSLDYRGYPDDVLAGREPACKSVRLFCERMLADLDATARKGSHLEFDEGAAADLCDFVESFLTVQDYVAGRRMPWKLLAWQRFLFATVNGWRIGDAARDGKYGRLAGTRRFRRLFMLLSKGQGKSPAMAALAAFDMLRDPSFNGVVCGATEYQARRVLDELRLMIASDETLGAALKYTGGTGPTAHPGSR